MRERSPLSEAVPIFIATIFLILPVVLLLIFAYKSRAAAEVYKNQDSKYAKAVIEAMRPLPQYVSHSLVPIDPTEPVTVVTWMQQKWVSTYKNGETPRSIWVTVAPRLQSFCRDYVRSNGDDLRQLTLRLEQRLGLPPNSGNDTFVELKLAPAEVGKVSQFFRPCADPSTTGATCNPALPADKADEGEKVKAYWFLGKYYWSYAAPEKDGRETKQYPWTSLGYTFDWAPTEEGDEDFVRWGESEFVVSEGTPVQFVTATDTAKYCAPQ
jgi:hypothetical protein